jgi:hypothetical protein
VCTSINVLIDLKRIFGGINEKAQLVADVVAVEAQTVQCLFVFCTPILSTIKKIKKKKKKK